MSFPLRFYNWRALIAVLMLLGGYLENLPLLHHHEEEHACLEWDGSFFYLETEGAAPVSAPLRYLPVRIGESHDHDPCGLCQILPSLLQGQLAETIFYRATNSFGSHAAQWIATSFFDDYRPRGPPLFS